MTSLLQPGSNILFYSLREWPCVVLTNEIFKCMAPKRHQIIIPIWMDLNCHGKGWKHYDTIANFQKAFFFLVHVYLFYLGILPQWMSVTSLSWLWLLWIWSQSWEHWPHGRRIHPRFTSLPIWQVLDSGEKQRTCR